MEGLLLNGKKIKDKIICLECGKKMILNKDGLFCQCGKRYLIKNKKIYTIDPRKIRKFKDKSMLGKIKEIFKENYKLYNLTVNIFSPVLQLGLNHRCLTNKVNPQRKIVLNLGSGPIKLDPGIINIDIFPYEIVDIVANIEEIPLADRSVNGIISIAVLEHTPNPDKIISEIYRILKPGGYIYILLPFMQGYHSSPKDYYRWTSEGFKKKFDQFRIVNFGVRSGPTAALLWIFQEWLANLLSFNIPILHTCWLFLLMFITFPIKLLDFVLVNFHNSQNIASTFYLLGQKK